MAQMGELNTSNEKITWNGLLTMKVNRNQPSIVRVKATGIANAHKGGVIFNIHFKLLEKYK